VYFGGSSPAVGEVASEYADVYLTWGEPPAQVAEKIAWIRALAPERGREVRFGIRLHVITRDTSAAAWAHAESLLAAIDPAVIAKVQAGLAESESEGRPDRRVPRPRHRRVRPLRLPAPRRGVVSMPGVLCGDEQTAHSKCTYDAYIGDSAGPDHSGRVDGAGRAAGPPTDRTSTDDHERQCDAPLSG
jgi:alkanesulfonate monooxygenase SsuD/methylene tetrahydromethanopterin reductase-like flavin-dependent oxidoreductase (luciferase family)